jgi:hypothetical protein
MSPTQRARAELKKLGAVSAIVERWNPHSRVRQDLFGWMDIIALLGPNTLGLQVTSGTNHAARRAKILAEPRALAWLQAGNLVEIWSVRKAGPRGKRKLWQIRKEALTLEDFRLRPVS